jgi:hypothetical protein
MILKKWMPVLGKDHAQTNNLETSEHGIRIEEMTRRPFFCSRDTMRNSELRE